MRRRLLLALVLLGLLSDVAVVFGDYPRHMDPALLVLENPGPEQLFEFYGQVYGLVSVSNYGEAMRLLASVEDVSAPAATMQAMEQYNLLLGSVIGELNRTEGDLAEAYEHLKWLRETLAEESLAESGRWLSEANGTAVDLGTASESLAGVLRSDPGRLLEGVGALNGLIDELNAQILEGLEEVEAIRALRLEGLEETLLKLTVDEVRPELGSRVEVTGFLADSLGVGLVNKVVDVYLDGSRVGWAVTDDRGIFEYSIGVPYRYVPVMNVWAEYWPVGEDLGSYLPSVSDLVLIGPVYEKPVLKVEAPSIVYPGKSYRMNGSISVMYTPLSGATVSVSWLGSTRSVVSGDDGGFTVELATPGSVAEGSARVTVSSEAEGEVGPATVSQRIQVVRLPLNVRLEKPDLVLSGRDAVVSGAVKVGGAPLAGCLVKVHVSGGVVYSTSDSAGAFSVSLPTGFLASSGVESFKVVVSPLEPWVRVETLSSGFVIVNSLVAFGLPLLGAAAVIRKRRAREVEGAAVQRLVPVAAHVAPAPLRGLPDLYMKAAELVGQVTGVRLRASETIREYLGAVRARLLGSDYRIFSGFSGLYERWLYGGMRLRTSVDEAWHTIERMKKLVEQG